jgi:serine/threonine protein kinase
LRRQNKQGGNNKQPYIKKGRVVGGWKLIRVLGKGGNGEVWEVSKNGDVNHAMKFLKKTDQVSYERFKDEVYVLSSYSIEGIINLIDSELPEVKGDSTPWFVMPKATRSLEFLKDKKPVEIVDQFIFLACTLDLLHCKEISHRDIKPDNLLVLNNRVCFADFGLVKYPNKNDVTEVRRDVGPRFTMAPEMRREAYKADGFKADVYSLAKTLWIMLTRISKGFDGQYNPFSDLSIKKHCDGIYTTILDNLLVECTDNLPANRPTAQEFRDRLIEWKNLNGDLHSRVTREWVELHNVIFPTGTPKRVSWTNIDSICSVLNEVAKVKSLNHMFYPDGGGMDLVGVSRASEDGMIALGTGLSADLVKPKELLYESFSYGHQWNYFRLELEAIDPIIESNKYAEYLVEIEPGRYVNRQCWEEREYDGKPLPTNSRPVGRYTGGVFVIFSKRSIYNTVNGELDAYDGRHGKMSADEFRAHIEDFGRACFERKIERIK